jgi:cation/acetate symporter
VGAIVGMIGGLAIIYCAMLTHAFFGGTMASAWFGIQPIACGVFGLPLGFVLIVAISLLTPPPPPPVQSLVENVRYPYLDAAET